MSLRSTPTTMRRRSGRMGALSGGGRSAGQGRDCCQGGERPEPVCQVTVTLAICGQVLASGREPSTTASRFFSGASRGTSRDEVACLHSRRSGTDLGFRGSLGRDGLGHRLIEVHDVVGRELRQLLGSPSFQRVWLVRGPVGTLVMIVGSKEAMHASGSVQHIPVRLPGGIVPLVMLAWPRQSREV